MDNTGRVNLITRFKCAKCGSQLSLSYDKEKSSNDYENDGITGAFKVENDVFIEPCVSCLSKFKEPLEALQRVMKVKL